MSNEIILNTLISYPKKIKENYSYSEIKEINFLLFEYLKFSQNRVDDVLKIVEKFYNTNFYFEVLTKDDFYELSKKYKIDAYYSFSYYKEDKSLTTIAYDYKNLKKDNVEKYIQLFKILKSFNDSPKKIKLSYVRDIKLKNDIAIELNTFLLKTYGLSIIDKDSKNKYYYPYTNTNFVEQIINFNDEEYYKLIKNIAIELKEEQKLNSIIKKIIYEKNKENKELNPLLETILIEQNVKNEKKIFNSFLTKKAKKNEKKKKKELLEKNPNEMPIIKKVYKL